MTIEITGRVLGTVRSHTQETLAATWDKAYLVLPSDNDQGFVETTPEQCEATQKHHTILFAHGSSGVNPAIRAFAQWVAKDLRLATVVPDSMQTPDRITYESPISRKDYEDIHAMRSQELTHAACRLANAPWFDGVYVVSGTSEGGLTAARFDASQLPVKEAGKMIFSWSCEENYFVDAPVNVFAENEPVLNVMSLTDKFFSPANSYLDNEKAFGYARLALMNNPNAEIVLLPQAPHTLLNLPQTHGAVKAFFERIG